MKKLLLAALLLMPALLVASQPLTADNLNAVLIDTLAVFQDSKTKVGVDFRDLQHSSSSVEKLALKAWLYRKGLANTLDLNVSQLEYDYTNKKDPTLKFQGSMDLDLVKAIGQKELNDMADDLEQMVQDFAKDLLDEYGDAADAKATVVQKSLDKNGNYEELKVEFNIKMDMAKLPNSKPESEVEITQASALVKINPQTIEAEIMLNFNPAYSGYSDDAAGLKKRLDLLVNRDQDAIQGIQEGLAWALSFIDKLLEQDYSK